LSFDEVAGAFQMMSPGLGKHSPGKLSRADWNGIHPSSVHCGNTVTDGASVTLSCGQIG
jgi:hypothetical protein